MHVPERTRTGNVQNVTSQPTGARDPGHPAALLRFAHEVGLVTALFLVYNLGRVIAARNTSGAFEAARWVWEAERTLRLPSEQVVQALILDTTMLVRLANTYYTWAHFPVALGVMLWLYFVRPDAYRWARRSLTVATFGALAMYVAVPVAPPRMMASLGFVDTAAVYGQSIYQADTMGKLANQFAAMPSMHVGWAVLLAVVLVARGRSPLRWLWLAHPTITVAVVVVTANHYWLDGFAGIVIVVGALLWTRSRTSRSSGAPVRAEA